MTEAVSKAGGVLGWWMNSISHSKICTSQWTEISISSCPRSAHLVEG